jgi:hypothetical protein
VFRRVVPTRPEPAPDATLPNELHERGVARVRVGDQVHAAVMFDVEEEEKSR